MSTEPTRRDLLSHSTRLALLLASVGMLPALAQAQGRATTRLRSRPDRSPS